MIGCVAWPSQQAKERKSLLKTIVSIHTEVMENYGSPRMYIELIESGHEVSKGRVEESCASMTSKLNVQDDINELMNIAM